jgi:hypothetical protein
MALIAASAPLNAPTCSGRTPRLAAKASVKPAYSGYVEYAWGDRSRIASTTFGLGPNVFSLKSRRSSVRRPSSGAT